ncbi:MAG TPA: peptidylprolyl isomerase [Anditalea sp.]|nr:peptidylprolyl isomerase [Anditalea sp.]
MKKKEYLKSLKNKGILLLGFVTLISSCDSFRFKKEENGDDAVIARVDEQILKRSELLSITGSTNNPADSASLADRYIQSWIKKQLMIREAGNEGDFDEAELNRKLLDYKYALMVYEFEKSHIDRNLDEHVTDAEIEQYYNLNRDNFILKEIIVRLNFIKIEKNLSQNTQIDKLLKANRDNKNEIEQLAIKSASNYFLEDSTWVKFDDITINTPLYNHPNKVQLLRQNKLIKVDDEDYTYYLKILEYKLEDQVPPIEFVDDEITTIILNKRRVALADQLQKEVYNRARENNEFTIYE